MKKIILVDGNNLVFRSYYGTAYNGIIMKNSKGFPTNALYGFISMMHKIILEEKPNYILVAFDKGKTFRHKEYDFYKAGRNETPIELKQQFPVAKEVLDAMGIKYFEIENYEADDIIGTLSKIVDEEDKFYATIVSSDKDLLQLVSDEVNMKLLKSNDSIYVDPNKFMEMYGTSPIKMIDLKALMGDPSDNLPGVKGIGEKTAISLITKYGSLDGVYENIDNISGKLKEKLINGKDDAYTSYYLATIFRDVPINFTLEDCKYLGIDREKFLSYLEEFEFNSFIRKIDSFDINNSSPKEDEVVEIKRTSIDNFSNKPFSFFVEVLGDNYSRGQVMGISLYDGSNSYYIEEADIIKYKDIFSSDIPKYTYDLKKNIVVLNKYGIDIKCSYDLMIASYLLDYNDINDISLLGNSFNYNIISDSFLFGSVKKPKEYDLEQYINNSITKCMFIYNTYSKIIEDINNSSMGELFNDIEMPLVYVLASMEIEGIRVSREYLDKMSNDITAQLKKLEEDIYNISGETFNIMSPMQLGHILFDVLKLPYPKKVKDNKYSTSHDILNKIKDIDIVNKVLEYRKLNKLYTNYCIGLINEIREDGKIHTTYTQTLTRTGRLSSISPNLQNIPARDQYGKLIRCAFVAEDGCKLLSSDYSQVELRVFASVSNDPNMCDAFNKDIDIHTNTAAQIYGVRVEDVTKDMRRSAKAVNFGILYGISSFGLSEDLGIDLVQAKKFIDNYLDSFPNIKEYMDGVKKDAYLNGYVKTIMNRRRIIKELNSSNYMIRQSGERMALNTPIQGSAADILKKAMVDIYNKFRELNLKSRMLLQIHDEIVFNVYDNELDQVIKIVRDLMENAFPLKVKLKVDISYGDNLYDAK